MIRKTYVEINRSNITYNVKTIIKKYNNYKYYIGVVKADCYGHGIKCINSIIKGGCNFLAVAILEEALKIRKINKEIPILCLGYINPQYINICKKNNIRITINSLECAKELTNYDCNKLKVHIKINTGMNRLGISDKKDLLKIIKIFKNKNIEIEGIYTHIFDASDKDKTNKQFVDFKKFVNVYPNIPIIHAQASEALINYSKPDFINGCRLGIIMYGFTENHDIKLKSTFKLYSQVIQIHNLKGNETVGYNGTYKANSNDTIAVVQIGYEDGIIRKNTKRFVYIKNKKYPIIGNICMDMMFIKIDNNVKLYDKVEIIKDVNHIKQIAKHLDTIPYEIICSIGKRVPRIYK